MNPFGCVFRRELVRLSRHWQIYVIRGVFLVSLLVVLLVAVKDYAALGGTDLAVLGAQLLNTMAIVFGGALLLTLPALTCSMVLEEQQRDTLGVLLLTRLGARQILLQKLASRLAYALLILIGALPFATVLLVTGGVDPQQILVIIGIYWVIAWGSVTMGMLASTSHTSTVAATMTSYLLMVILMPFFTTPIYYLAELVYDYYQDETIALVASGLVVFVLSIGLLTVVLFYTAGNLNNAANRDVVMPAPSPRGERNTRCRPAPSGTFLRLFLERELHLWGLPFRWVVPPAFVLALVTGVVLGFEAGWTDLAYRSTWAAEEWAWFVLIPVSILGTGGVLLQASGNLPRERRQLTFKFLMISPVSTGHLVMAKLVGLLMPAAVGLLMMVLVILPHLGWIAWHAESVAWGDRLPGLLLWCAVFLVMGMSTVWLLVTGSLRISYRMRNSLVATAFSAGVLLFLLLLIVKLSSWFGDGGWTPLPPKGQLDSLVSCVIYCSLNVLAGSLFLARFTVLLNRDRNLGDIA